MTLDEIRQTWLQQAEKMSTEVMQRYHEQRMRNGPAGHEGLGIYGTYQERVARKKIQIAIKLLKKYGYDLTTSNIHKITHQNRATIEGYLPTPILKERQHNDDEARRQIMENLPEDMLAKGIPLKRNRERT